MIKRLSFLSIGMALMIFGVAKWMTTHQMDAPKTILQSISYTEKETLNVFFRMLLNDTQCGYVLCGNKPICGEGILPSESNPLMLGGELHKRSTILKMGCRLCQKLGLQGQDYIIHTYEKPSYGWNHFLLINRKAFIEVVQQNLPLFQYVLGPRITPESLFQQLIDPRESLSSVFNNDKVLIGIVLGFGQQNGLYVSRLENIQDYEQSREQPPFKSIRERFNTNFRAGFSDFGMSIRPSFGYDSLVQETNDLNGLIQTSKGVCSTSPLTPSIPFGCIPSSETTRLIDGYLLAPKKIQKLLASDKFLEEVLAYFTNAHPKTAAVPALVSDVNDKCKLADLIANVIFHDYMDQKEEWMESIIEGMQAANNDEPQFPAALILEWREAARALASRQNFIASEQLFFSLAKKKDVHAIIPKKLHYRQIAPGKGKSLRDSGGSIKIECSISNQAGSGLSVLRGSTENSAIEVNVDDLLPSFVLAMQGMVEGEEREVFIHPSLAYGEAGNIEPNVALIARVKLIEIINNANATYTPDIQYLKLVAESAQEEDLRSHYKQLDQNLAFYFGKKIWSHYRQGQNLGYNLDEVVNSLRTAPKTKSSNNPVPQRSDQQLTAIHWAVYQNIR